MLLESLMRTPELMTLPPPAARVVGALRHWVVASRTGRCPMSALAAKLGCVRGAAHLHLLLDEIGAAWPDPFAVSPPCCARLSHDEALVADMLTLAGRGNQPGFDRLLADLLPADIRERLFHSASVLLQVLEE